jgi:hypothetical protein
LKHLYRQSEDRENKIEDTFEEIMDPGSWANEQGTQHYELQSVDNVSAIGFSLGIPFTYHAKSLKTNYRLKTKMDISNYIEYIPYNDDDYCIMHCIYNEVYNPEQLSL